MIRQVSDPPQPISRISDTRSEFQSPDDEDGRLQRLASGRRATEAADDPASVAISVMFAGELKGYYQASRNANDGVSVVNQAEAGLAQSAELLGRARALALRSGSGALNADQRAALDQEMATVVTEIGRISEATAFNGLKLLSGPSTELNFQVGINGQAPDQVSLSTVDASVSGLGLGTLDVSVPGGAQAALAQVDSALENLTRMRGDVGATGSRLANAQAGIKQAALSKAASLSRLQDADVALETSELASATVRQAARVAVTAQSNIGPALASRLLEG